MEKIDLHIHTNYSDGTLNIPQLIVKLNRKGIKKISITDHDTIVRIVKYFDLFKENNIELVTGIEFNTNVRNLHILGYGIEDLEKVENTITDIKYRNVKVCLEVIKLLQNAGIDITVEDIFNVLLEEAKTRMTLLNIKNGELDPKNLILDKRAIVKWLIKYGYADTVLEAYDKLIGREAPYYVPIEKFDKYDVIKLIKDSGGVPVIAHPMSVEKNSKNDYYNFIGDLKDKGLQGIEVYGDGPRMETEWIKFFSDISSDLNLIKTAGSDFHKPKDSLGVLCDESIYENLLTTIEQNPNRKKLERKK